MSDNINKTIQPNNDENINMKTSENKIKIENSIIYPSLIQEEQNKGPNSEIRIKSRSKESDNLEFKKMTKNSLVDISQILDNQPREKDVSNFDGTPIIEAFNDNQQEPQQQENNRSIFIPRYKRCLFFVFIVLVNICVNLDEGNMPAATEQIQKDLKITPSQLGLFGSLQYSGNAAAMIIIDKFDRKILLIIFLILTGLGLWAFTITRNLGFLYFDRIILGIFQSFITIYCPVWVDQFGPRNRKTVMMSFLQIGSPFGVVLGYTLTTLILKARIKWQFSFIIQAVIFGLFVVINIFLPKIYFSKSLKCINPTNIYLEENKKTGKKMSVKNKNMSENTSLEISKKDPKVEDVISLYQDNNESDEKLKSFWRNLCRLVKIKVYMICVAASSVLLFISCAILFWTTNYLTTVMKINRTIVSVAFISTSITAPASGIIIGGCIVQRFGGYESRKSLFICCIYGLCAVLCGIPITLFDSIIGFAIFLWLFLFFGGCIVPNLIGIILSALPKDLRAAGNSVTVFFNTIMGFLPAPFTYGVIHESTLYRNPRFAYGFTVMYSIVSLAFIITGAIIREKEFQIKMKEEKGKRISKENNETSLNNKDKSIMFYNSNSQFKLNENNNVTNYVSDINIVSNRLKRNLNYTDDLIENVSNNEVFVNKILDNSIKVKELKMSMTNTFDSVNKNKGILIECHPISLTESGNPTDKLRDDKVIFEGSQVKINQVKFNKLKNQNEKEIKIEREIKGHTDRN